MKAAKAVRRYGAVTTWLLLAGAFAAVLPASAARARSVPVTSSLLYPALFGVAATSAKDAWAVGQYQCASGPLRPLILRWNGKVWRQTPSPDLVGALAAVTVTSATGAWAVGLGGTKTSQTIIEHWNGKAWTVMQSPVRDGNLDGVAATSASDVWAVGFSGNWTASHALVLHWNGQAWRQVPAPDQPGNGIFWGVAATSARNAWAVSGAAQKALDVNKTVIEQWNGTAWARVPSANPKPGGGILSGVAAVSASNAWAVGFDEDFAFGFEGVIEHWNGTSW